MKQLNQNDIVTVAGGIYLSVNLSNDYLACLNAFNDYDASQNAFRVESNTYSSHWSNNAQLSEKIRKILAKIA